MFMAKAIYAFIMAGLTAAAALYTDNAILIIVLAALTPIGTYLVPNTPQVTVTNNNDPVL